MTSVDYDSSNKPDECRDKTAEEDDDQYQPIDDTPPPTPCVETGVKSPRIDVEGKDEEEAATAIKTTGPAPTQDEVGAGWSARRRRFVVFWLVLLGLGVVIAIVVVVIKFGAGTSVDSSSAAGSSIVSHPPTLVRLREEGVLRCGVPVKRGFSVVNQVTGDKEGMSVDFCKAVAAAVLGPDGEVELVDVTSETRFAALAHRSIDVLVYGDTHTMERDFNEVRLNAPQMTMILYIFAIYLSHHETLSLSQVTTGMGFQFTDPYLYDWLGFAGTPSGVKCADEFNWSGECDNLKICVRSGTTHEEILRTKFPSKTIIGKDDSSMLFQGLVDSDCNVLAGEQSDISEALARDTNYTGEFVHGTQQLSKEPLGEFADYSHSGLDNISAHFLSNLDSKHS
jgi:ABC-type amino acid transport substrate-binding protein